MNTLAIGVQSKNIVFAECPLEGFEMMKRAGFSCCDLSLDSYLLDTAFRSGENKGFFDRSVGELKSFFTPYKEAAATAGVKISQISMPYMDNESNTAVEAGGYLVHTVAPKSMELCAFLDCPYLVLHGLDHAEDLGMDTSEREQVKNDLELLASMAVTFNITLCLENGYINTGKGIGKGAWCDAGEAAAYIDRMNERHGVEVLGFCFDTGHANLTGIGFEDFITILGKRLKVLHIHDNDGIGDLHQIPFTYTDRRGNASSADWNGLIRGLQKIQYDKVLSFETASVLSSFPKIMRQDVLRLIAQVGSYFAGEIRADGGLCLS